MSGFKYQAVDSAGRVHRGVMECDSSRQARVNLREQGLIALEVEALTRRKEASPRSFFQRGLAAGELSLLTRQFATLLSAGLTIEQTMNALIEQAETEKLRHVLAGVRGEVLGGQTLARSMEKFPRVFPDLYRALVAAGERSGQLGNVMLRLADYLESRDALKQKVQLAFIYPAILTAVALLIVVLLLTYVVPQVVGVFQNTRQTLPWLTVALIAISDFIRQYGWIIAVLIAASAMLARNALRAQAVRFRLHSFLLKLPIVGRLIRTSNSARLSSTLAILVGSGVPLLDALRAGVGVVSNLPTQKALEYSEKKVAEGASLSRSLARTKMFPPLMVHMIASGEATGTLDQMLERAAMQQSQELERRVAALVALLEPMLILTMGAVVLIIVLAILLPIFELNTLVR
ncbi:MAG: type II secretion system inner membrane protein GspF [Burkholderiales bacterium]